MVTTFSKELAICTYEFKKMEIQYSLCRNVYYQNSYINIGNIRCRAARVFKIEKHEVVVGSIRSPAVYGLKKLGL